MSLAAAHILSARHFVQLELKRGQFTALPVGQWLAEPLALALNSELLNVN